MNKDLQKLQDLISGAEDDIQFGEFLVTEKKKKIDNQAQSALSEIEKMLEDIDLSDALLKIKPASSKPQEQGSVLSVAKTEASSYEIPSAKAEDSSLEIPTAKSEEQISHGQRQSEKENAESIEESLGRADSSDATSAGLGLQQGVEPDLKKEADPNIGAATDTDSKMEPASASVPAPASAPEPAPEPKPEHRKPKKELSAEERAARILKAAETGDERYLVEEEESFDAAEKPKEDEEEIAYRKLITEEENVKSSKIKTILMGILTIVFIIAAAVAVILTFFRDTDLAHNIRRLWTEEATVSVETAENGEEGENAESPGGSAEGEQAQSGESQGGAQSETQGDAQDGAAKQTGDTTSIIGQAISKKLDLAEGIGMVEAPRNLKFEIEKDYGVEGVTKAITFDDDIWYISDATESIHYTDEIVGFVIDYYSKLYKRINKDDDAVLDLIVPESKLLGDVTAIKSDAIVIHTLNKLEIGEIRRLDQDFYVMVNLYESTNDGKQATTQTKVLRLSAIDKEIKAAEIADVQ